MCHRSTCVMTRSFFHTSEVPGRKKDDSVHIDLAADIVKALFDDNLTRT